MEDQPLWSLLARGNKMGWTKRKNPQREDRVRLLIKQNSTVMSRIGKLPVSLPSGVSVELLDGNVVKKRYVSCRVVADERITDGFYMASAFKYLMRILKHPEVLDNPPDQVLPQSP